MFRSRRSFESSICVPICINFLKIMTKRYTLPDIYGTRKRLKVGIEKDGSCLTGATCISDTEAALIYIKNQFPLENFGGQLPPIILVHQAYSIIKNKTKVDQDVESLKVSNKIRMFRLGSEETAMTVIFKDDFLKHIETCCPDKSSVKRLVESIIPAVTDVSVDKDLLMTQFKLKQEDLRDLVGAGLLTVRSSTSYWFSFPNAGEFMKCYTKGRKSVLRTISKCKYGEILKSELEERKLEKSAKLGMAYHIHDIVGADLVTCIETTSGTLLRILDR